MINIIDTFEDFKNCFANNLNLSTEEKIKLWEECYISKYPELEHKCKSDYEDNDYHWRDTMNILALLTFQLELIM